MCLITLRYREPDLDVVIDGAESNVADQRAICFVFDHENVGALSWIRRIRVLSNEKLEY